MNMKDFIQNEKDRLQSLFDEFNRDGSWMKVSEGEYTPLMLGLIDSYTVTRVAPHFDTQSRVTKTDFWLMWKSVGYNNGFQYTHTIKVIEWSQDDTYLLDMTDDRGRCHHVELIMNVSEPHYMISWRIWQEYKAENRDMFERIDAQLLDEHIIIAEEWQI
jgi:hypothetical protein